MDKIVINDTAYKKLISFLDAKGIENYNIRIDILGGRCSGPKLGFSASDVTAYDVVEKVKDVNFIIRQALAEECSGFTILSSEENDGAEISIVPFNAPKKDCRLCGRGCP